MDYVFISKVIVTIVLYFLIRLAYVKIDWLSNDNNRKATIMFYVISSIFAIPLVIAVIVLGFSIFNGIFSFLDTQNYWKQIIIIFGFIVLFFLIRINLEDKISKQKQKDELIINQRNKIRILEFEIKRISKFNNQ